MAEAEACSICGSSTHVAFRHCVLNSHDAEYRHCGNCGFLYAVRPHWLAQAYSSAISAADTGLVARNLDLAEKLSTILAAFFDMHGRFLDLAGGTGLLVRLMRDRGFDYFWEDRYCQNQHAVGFEAEAEEQYEAASAFEALEHMERPMMFVADALARTRTRTLFFSTELHSGKPPPQDWWYYAFSTGQHISFFARHTLAYMGSRLGCSLISSGGLHVLTSLSLSERKYSLVLRYLRRHYLRKIRRTLASRIDSDHRAMLSRGNSSLPSGHSH